MSSIIVLLRFSSFSSSKVCVGIQTQHKLIVVFVVVVVVNTNEPKKKREEEEEEEEDIFLFEI